MSDHSAGPVRQWWPPEMLDRRLLDKLPELNRKIFDEHIDIFVGLA